MFQLSAEDLSFIRVTVEFADSFDQSLVLNRAVIDSRQVSIGDLFVCLKGESTDGHNFVKSAVTAGAKALLIDTDLSEFVKSQLRNLPPILLLESSNVIFSLQQLAKLRRQRFQGQVIGVVGSNGKTSTKEMLASLLKCRFGDDLVFATPGNLNNHIGLPLSVLAISDLHKFAVLELGMNHVGEIDLLSNISRPNHVIVTSIGFEHMEFFKSIDEVALAELEVVNGMNGGRILYPASGPQLPHLQSIAVKNQVSVQLFELENYCDGKINFQGHNFSLGEYFGEAMASNLLSSVALILSENYMSATQLETCCRQLKPNIGGRLRIEMMGNTVVIDDSYNANPDSFRKSILALREKLKNGRLLCLAGHMAELGHFSEVGHRQVGEDLKKAMFDQVIVCGNTDVKILMNSFSKDKPQHYFADSALLASYIEENPNIISRFDGILIKGSRSARMERLLPTLRKILIE
ncbi:MAG: UDP-N-acetylmuramoyl-tripeptide--D-alanyl-D-alanine ligase [Leptonema sp. (in: Bacteria)]|nr:UDP-N-acetylmuramoyl-tripeptide--D-alanyl-D-alanine ligase [Leptonema sp. (in: bacteria)]